VQYYKEPSSAVKNSKRRIMLIYLFLKMLEFQMQWQSYDRTNNTVMTITEMYGGIADESKKNVDRHRRSTSFVRRLHDDR
jgi:hypothetical protein